ncbi:RnfH family protein [Ostreibacterium oceani]|uniref:UPF0125 protein GCU85_01240 n=1 Tax=Ostreibacterium oceani TaxID=2654998 RepID=A0A6N7EW86_9GAMM|nr:RnfH family protein [Ostreibacterium oceani]MPV85357.1 RnfH family protein [Ostreibacterium oceani]
MTAKLSASDTLIAIEVAYATPARQMIIPLQVSPQTSVRAAIQQSGILGFFPDIVLETATVGIWSKVCEPNQIVQAGDRIEIYRPLVIDPMEQRRQRAKK